MDSIFIEHTIIPLSLGKKSRERHRKKEGEGKKLATLPRLCAWKLVLTTLERNKQVCFCLMVLLGD